VPEPDFDEPTEERFTVRRARLAPVMISTPVTGFSEGATVEPASLAMVVSRSGFVKVKRRMNSIGLIPPSRSSRCALRQRSHCSPAGVDLIGCGWMRSAGAGGIASGAAGTGATYDRGADGHSTVNMPAYSAIGREPPPLPAPTVGQRVSFHPRLPVTRLPSFLPDAMRLGVPDAAPGGTMRRFPRGRLP
jgi:hypothetical protein